MADIGGGDDEQSGGSGGAGATAPLALQAPLRRLSNREYANTVRDLVGFTPDAVAAFPPEEEIFGFDNNVVGQTVSLAHTDKYQTAAEQIASRATENLPGLLGCDPAALPPAETDACVNDFIGLRFGPKAYRRLLSEAETAKLFALYQAGATGSTVREGVEWVVTALLQSPHFLYRPEFGVPEQGDELGIPLNDFEIASRLSYFLWQSMPDDTLLLAARDGQLRTIEQIEAQTRRLLDDPRARPAITNFFMQWFRIGQVGDITKSAELFPEFDDALRAAMQEESERFIAHTVWDGAGTLEQLLTSSSTFANSEIAALYGLPAPSTADWVQVELDPSQRAGLLTQPLFMARLSDDYSTSPVQRGLFVRKNLMCQSIPPPPADLVIEVPPQVAGQSTRQRFEQHRSDPYCAGCHTYFDPIGFGFEHYDAIGRFRTTEEYGGQSVPIDASGEILEIDDAQDVAGTFNGAVELANMLAGSQLVQHCMNTRMFRFAFGRQELEGDEAALAELDAALTQHGGSIREMIVKLTKTKSFRFRNRWTAGE